ncbi:MAG: ABC transporter ATP-binding protein [Actinomycetota bacterium]|nr:ABC transporter ATP-binding protein [Actinomycetota bacterium]
MKVDSDSIIIENLSLSYGVRRAVSGLDLKVERGETLAIYGPNGAGKTSLLKLIATLLKPKSGSISYFGLTSRDDPASVKRMIGYSAHETLLYKDLTAQDNLIFYGGLYGLSDPKRRALEILDLVGLSGRRGDAVRSLSKGMGQRLAIGRTLLHDPQIILLDEPLSGLDLRAASIFERLMSRLKEDKKTVIFTTHDFESGLGLSDSAAVMAGGKIRFRSQGEAPSPNDFKEIYASALEGGP